MPQIRQANLDEYQSLLRVLSEAYNVPLDFFPERFPSWWGEYTDFSRIWVLARGGRIESLVRIFPLQIVLGEVTVSVGGIGNVATLPAARGQGHMHHLMYRAIEEMREEFCLSVLWGDRHRYRLFGYDLGGRSLTMKIAPRGLRKMGIEPLAPEVYFGEDSVLKHIKATYREQLFRRIRDGYEDRLIYDRSGLVVWTGGTGDHFGYLAFSPNEREPSVAEFGGRSKTVLGLVAELCRVCESPAVTLTFPTREAVEPDYWEAVSAWAIEPSALVRILHLSPVVRLFRPWLTANAEAADPRLVHLPEHEAVDRLFGVGRPGAIPFFCGLLDRV